MLTQRGVTITGSRSTSARIISNDMLPEPMTIEARSSMVGTPDDARVAPDLLAARQVGRQVVAVAEAAQVDDAAHAGGARRGAKVGRAARSAPR